MFLFFFSSRRRHTRWPRDWSSACALPIYELADAIDELARLLIDHPDFRAAEFVWAHYWISAEAGLRAHDIAGESVRPPLAVSMHTIGAVKNRDSDRKSVV